MLPVRRRDEPARVNWCLSFCIWRWGSFPLLLFFVGMAPAATSADLHVSITQPDRVCLYAIYCMHTFTYIFHTNDSLFCLELELRLWLVRFELFELGICGLWRMVNNLLKINLSYSFLRLPLYLEHNNRTFFATFPTSICCYATKGSCLSIANDSLSSHYSHLFTLLIYLFIYFSVINKLQL